MFLNFMAKHTIFMRVYLMDIEEERCRTAKFEFIKAIHEGVKFSVCATYGTIEAF